ncbi:MAG TPA: hypothetical protein VGP36_10365 [Mycobacteriales bacterium]|nr:hypothetical protein [Mycobacteriales bacterium]
MPALDVEGGAAADQVLTAPGGQFRVTTIQAVLPVRVAVIRGPVAAAYVASPMSGS